MWGKGTAGAGHVTWPIDGGSGMEEVCASGEDVSAYPVCPDATALVLTLSSDLETMGLTKKQVHALAAATRDKYPRLRHLTLVQDRLWRPECAGRYLDMFVNVFRRQLTRFVAVYSYFVNVDQEPCPPTLPVHLPVLVEGAWWVLEDGDGDVPDGSRFPFG